MGSEDLSRWQSAGYSPNKKCASIAPVSTAASRSGCGCGTASCFPLTRRAPLATPTFRTGDGARIQHSPEAR
jgi:hypothetical protein